MKLSDELLLKSLRAGVLSGVSEDHWDLVCKAVDDAGDIREVRGYARTVIFDAIEKFNPYHDEVGRFTSGGAGGAGLGGRPAAGRSGGRERSGKNVAEAMRKYPDLAPFADKVGKMPFVTEKDLNEMLPDYIAGKSITNAFRESDASPTTQFLDTTDIESDMGGGAKGFLDTTDIEPDMGTGANAGLRRDTDGKIIVSGGSGDVWTLTDEEYNKLGLNNVVKKPRESSKAPTLDGMKVKQVKSTPETVKRIMRALYDDDGPATSASEIATWVRGGDLKPSEVPQGWRAGVEAELVALEGNRGYTFND